jgi:hypothetical protein
MKSLKLLEDIAIDQFDNFSKKKRGIERDIDFSKYLKTEQIVVISGIRRAGKSTLLKQFSEKLKDFYYINFEDERLVDFTVDDFNNLMIIWKKNWKSNNVLIDEIQNVEKWELFVARLKSEGYKVFITGSNSKLLSSEFATRLTGRYSMIKLYPFSFKEFITFKNIKFDKITSNVKAEMLKLFDEYLIEGGFPNHIILKDEEFLETVYKDIIYKDIITRFKIRGIKKFRQFTNFIFTNFTKEINYNSIAKTLEIKSANSVIDYIEVLEESYLIFELFKYNYSQEEQFRGDKKLYVIDNGMRKKIAFYFSEDRGRFLENMVFVELKRRGKEVFYFKDKNECDFIVRNREKIVETIQVCNDLNDSNEKRELAGLIAAMKCFNVKEGLILTDNQEEERIIEGLKIKIMPTWKWLLEILK